MEKEIIILAKSKKYGGYCVAGIDANTGKWIRLNSNNKESHGAVPKTFMKDCYGHTIDVLDRIKVNIKQYIPEGMQIENYLYDESTRFIRQGKVTLNYVLAKIYQKAEDYIFYNVGRWIPKEDINQIPCYDWHSLQWIQARTLSIYTKYNEYKDRVSYRGEIEYKGHYYRDLSITDESFIERCQKEKIKSLKNPFLVMSLGVPFEKDNRQYKLIATVLENKPEKIVKRSLFSFSFNEVPF